jgi:centromere protein C
MEEVDGLFSSPEKSPAKFGGFENEDNDSSIGSDGMSIDEGARPPFYKFPTNCMLT